MASRKLKIAFVHPDLGIGVFVSPAFFRIILSMLKQAALNVSSWMLHLDCKSWGIASIYTPPTMILVIALRRHATVRSSLVILWVHHRLNGTLLAVIGTLRVHYVVPPFPRAIKGKLHIVFAHARAVHLSLHLVAPGTPKYDVYFVDQLSTYVPFLRSLAHTRVLFYCHFPDKLLADGAYVEGRRPRGSLLKRIYRVPMDFFEEATTSAYDSLPKSKHHLISTVRTG